MQKSVNKIDAYPYYGYNCPCCGGWNVLTRAQIKRFAIKEMEEELHETIKSGSEEDGEN